MKMNKMSICYIVSTIFFVSPILQAKTFVVNSNIDESTCDQTLCTFRGAIESANENPGPDTIRFDLIASEKTIIPVNPLPVITEMVHINGANGQTAIENYDSYDEEINYSVLDIDRITINAIILPDDDYYDNCNATTMGGTPVLHFNGASASNSSVEHLQIENACVAIRISGEEAAPIRTVKIVNNIIRNTKGNAAFEAEYDVGTRVRYNNTASGYEGRNCLETYIRDNLFDGLEDSETTAKMAAVFNQCSDITFTANEIMGMGINSITEQDSENLTIENNNIQDDN